MLLYAPNAYKSREGEMPSAPERRAGYTSFIQLDIMSPGCYKEAAD